MVGVSVPAGLSNGPCDSFRRNQYARQSAKSSRNFRGPFHRADCLPTDHRVDAQPPDKGVHYPSATWPDGVTSSSHAVAVCFAPRCVLEFNSASNLAVWGGHTVRSPARVRVAADCARAPRRPHRWPPPPDQPMDSEGPAGAVPRTIHKHGSGAPVPTHRRNVLPCGALEKSGCKPRSQIKPHKNPTFLRRSAAKLSDKKKQPPALSLSLVTSRANPPPDPWEWSLQLFDLTFP